MWFYCKFSFEVAEKFLRSVLYSFGWLFVRPGFIGGVFRKEVCCSCRRVGTRIESVSFYGNF